MNDNSKNKRPPMGVENASKILRESSDLLTSIGIKNHFLAFGTCLILYRDRYGDMSSFENDWDIDYIMLSEDIEKMDNNKQKILDAGFTTFKKKRDIPKFIRENGEKSDELIVRTYSFVKDDIKVDVDVAHLSKDGEHRLIPKGRVREQFVGQFPKEMFDGNNSIEYRGKKYLIPSQVEKYFESNYGKDWNIPKYTITPWHRRSCRRNFYEIK